MLRISQLKLNYRHDTADFMKKLAKQLRLPENEILEYRIVKRSVDARKKDDICFIYTVDAAVKNEAAWLKKHRNEKSVTKAAEIAYTFPKPGEEVLNHRPVVAGSGPAGLFCALMLARHGYRPLLIERGESVEARKKTVGKFWETGILNTESNVQFGEGGAGTFSDGKLNTLVKDKYGRNTEVLRIFAQAGAGEEICYVNKPHIGTDVLADIVKNIRNEIISLGGEVRFNTKLTGLQIKDGSLHGIIVNDSETVETEVLVAALGHSARDSFKMLNENALVMTPKAFAVGVRIEHPQSMMNMAQYGSASDDILGAADYKLTYQASNGRSVYTFCMCPGGYVVNASSEEGKTAVNGMSYSKRDSDNANSAVIVSVTPEDFFNEGAPEEKPSKDKSVLNPLAGMYFQQRLEAACYAAAGNQPLIPVQLFEDFKNKQVSKAFKDVIPVHRGKDIFADLNTCLPDYICESLVEGIEAFGKKIKGFDRKDAILSGIETRTSSPIRIERDESFQSNILGIYPCGEGAGYAGGITSAAMDGIKVAEAIAKRYSSFEK